MSRVDDIDLTHDATAEQIFGFDLMTLGLGRLAEETTKRAPQGHGRHRVLFCLWIVLNQEHQTVALNDCTSFFEWAHAKWPPPRWTVELDPWQLSRTFGS